MELKRAILFVRNMAVMTEFYRDQLGLRAIGEGAEPGWIEFEAGGARLALHAIPEGILRETGGASASRAREETPIKLVFVVADVLRERNRLEARGVQMREVRAWGVCDGIDPEGNVFQLAGR